MNIPDLGKIHASSGLPKSPRSSFSAVNVPTGTPPTDKNTSGSILYNPDKNEVLHKSSVAIQGDIGSFHHIAAQKWFGNNVNIAACDTFKDVFACVKTNKADYGVIAIENSLFGSINEVYDLLLKSNFPIIGEILEPINQCLIGFKNTKLSTIKNVYSHPVALAQCSNFLDKYLPHAKRIENHDTAASVALVKHLNNDHSVAIASHNAARLYDMSILKKNIQNHKLNFTRFLVIQKTPVILEKTNKISLVLQTDHKPGALYEALGILAKNQINITKLQSRPIEGKPWSYMFYIDCLSTPNKFRVIQNNLEDLGNTITILGYYKEATAYRANV